MRLPLLPLLLVASIAVAEPAPVVPAEPAPVAPPVPAPVAPPESAPVAPPVDEYFHTDTSPTHAFVVLDVADGRVLRADGGDAGRDELVPLGSGRRFLEAIVQLEGGGLDPLETVACDETCWANGAHGSISFLNAFAWGCDTYFRDRSIPDATLATRSGPIGLQVRTEDGVLGASLLEWAEFWRELGRSRLRLRPATISHALAAAGTCVSSPRGLARALHDPRGVVRAAVGETPRGAWVTGTAVVPGGRRWAFAFFLRDGSASLATARCAHLLQETVRTARQSTRERGGEPWMGRE